MIRKLLIKYQILSLLQFALLTIAYLIQGFIVSFEVLLEFKYVFIPILGIFFIIFLLSLFVAEKSILKIRIVINIIFIVLFAIITLWCISQLLFSVVDAHAGALLLFIIYMFAPTFVINVIWLIIDIKRKNILYWKKVRRRYPDENDN